MIWNFNIVKNKTKHYLRISISFWKDKRNSVSCINKLSATPTSNRVTIERTDRDEKNINASQN